jgi:DNA topoisomerase-3
MRRGANMAKSLVLAEKPSVARDIAGVLKCTQKRNGYIEGSRYVITWALGHLVTLAEPEAYGEQYKTWKIEDLPMLPEPMRLSVIKETGKQFQTVKMQMSRDDIGEIIIATDAGREGELVARWIIEKAHIRKPIKRLWISSVTDRAILEGFSKLKDGKDYEDLYQSAVARSEADWYVGINATRALTCKFNAQLSCGRVQSPTLAMIACREQEIRNFVPKSYYGITASAPGLVLLWRDKKTGEYRTFDQAYGEFVYKKLLGKDAIVTKVDKSEKKQPAPLPYNLTELQKDANIRFSFSAKETLSIMQSLYETHKLLTYPRTDSRYLTSDIVETLNERIAACSNGIYVPMGAKVRNLTMSANLSFVDNSKVSDHHAIIPTEQRVTLDRLNMEERKVYDLVIRRFFAMLYPSYRYEQTSIEAVIGDETFIARGKRILSPGWKELYSRESEEEEFENELSSQIIPAVSKGDTLRISLFTPTSGKTKPPSRFTEATLLSAMENPAHFMEGENHSLIKTIEETGGLGTVATRADIIEKLINTYLVEKKGKELWITQKGEQLLTLVPEDLKSPALTAVWEQKLALIAKGKIKKDVFLSDMKRYASNIIGEIRNSTAVFKHQNVSGKRCPTCGKYMLEVKDKRGGLYVCQDRECGYRERILGPKATAISDKKTQKQGGLSKKEIRYFLKDQETSGTNLQNTALADALKSLKNKNDPQP